MIKTNDKFIFVMLIFLINIAPIFGDMTCIINFSDVIILVVNFIILTVFKKNKIRINRKISLVFFLIFLFLFFNINYFYITSPNYDLLKGFYYVFKLLLYLSFILISYKFILEFELSSQFLKILEIVSFFVVILGFFISVLLIFDRVGIPNILWKFTRSDASSYTFRNSNIIRTRSLFSEPSYLGIYLNSVIAIYCFPHFKFEYRRIVFILLIGSFMTFSISSIFISLFIILLSFKEQYHLIKTIPKHFKYAAIFFIAILLLIFRRQIYLTVIYRFIEILSGKDASTMSRLFVSWEHINLDNLMLGSGLGSSPAIWNNFAYIIGELGLIFVLIIVYFIRGFIVKNVNISIIFILINFSTGRFLNISFWYFILLILINNNFYHTNRQYIAE